MFTQTIFFSHWDYETEFLVVVCLISLRYVSRFFARFENIFLVLTSSLHNSSFAHKKNNSDENKSKQEERELHTKKSELLLNEREPRKPSYFLRLKICFSSRADWSKRKLEKMLFTLKRSVFHFGVRWSTCFLPRFSLIPQQKLCHWYHLRVFSINIFALKYNLSLQKLFTNVLWFCMDMELDSIVECYVDSEIEQFGQDVSETPFFS